MVPAWNKFLSLLLALSLAGVAHTCLCAGVIAPSIPASKSHTCCKSKGHAATPPAKDGCTNCNLRNRQVTSVPEDQLPIPAPLFLHMLSGRPEATQVNSMLARTSYYAARDVLMPPLLLDLYHCACSLTV